MSHDPHLMKHAAQKLDELLRSYEGAEVSGVVVRIGITDAVVVTREGRMQWFKQDHLGGVQKPPDPQQVRFIDRNRNARR
jgi:hypothetical protein